MPNAAAEKSALTGYDRSSVALAVLFLSLSPLVDQLLNHSRLFPENELRSVACASVLLVYGLIGGLAVILLGVIGAVCVQRGSQFPFKVVMFGLALALLIPSGIRHYRSPPTAAAYFEQIFGCPLPASASSIRVQGSTPADSNVLYSFSCTAVECSALTQQLGMEERTLVDGDAINGYFIAPSPRNWPDYTQWKNPRLYELRNRQTGRVDRLLCDASRTQVYVYKDPLGSKTDAEMNGEYSK